MLASRFFHNNKTSETLFKEFKRCSNVYKRDPYNKENLMKWVYNARLMMVLPDMYDKEPLNRLKDCTLKMDEALTRPESDANNPQDHEAWYMLGYSHYSIFQRDRDLGSYLTPSESCVQHAVRAAACLRQALNLEPNHHDSRKTLAGIKEHCTLVKSPQDFKEAVWEEVLDDEFLDAHQRIYDPRAMGLERIIRDARIEDKKNPNDADNLSRWGTSLLKLAYYQKTTGKSRKMILEAIPKLEKALELGQGDKRLKLKLLRGQLRLRIPRKFGDEEYVRLVKEYKILSEELGPDGESDDE